MFNKIIPTVYIIMNKKILVYIPTALNSPETEILLSVAQDNINKKNHVELLLCNGGKKFFCSKNIYSLKSICVACKKQTAEAIKVLKGKYIRSYIPTNYKIRKNSNKIFNIKKIVNYKYKGCDNGLSAYSSYVDVTKDRDLDGYFSNYCIKNLINTSNDLTDYFLQVLKRKKYTEIFMFNGRMNNYRPLLRVANKLGRKINNLEFNGNRNQVFNFENSLPIDQKYIAKRINDFWKNQKNKKLYLINLFVNKWIRHQALFHRKKFQINQNSNELPKYWDNKKRNIVYYASSPDETLTGGKTYFFKVFKDQVESIEFIYNSIKKINKFSDISFWVRMHPRMKGHFWPHLKKIYELKKKYPGLNLIYPESSCSSYEMLKKSSLVISPISSLSIEALHFKKPSINFQKHPFVLLGGSYLPKNKKEVLKLIFNKNLKPRSILAQKKFHLFYLDGGKKFHRVTGDFNDLGYKYNNKKIELNFFYKVIYYYGKIIEKKILNNLSFYLYKFIDKK